MSEPERPPSGGATWLLVVAILLVTIMALVIAFVPVATCLGCHGTGSIDKPYWSTYDPKSEAWRLNEAKPCKCCSGRKTISLLNQWAK